MFEPTTQVPNLQQAIVDMKRQQYYGNVFPLDTTSSKRALDKFMKGQGLATVGSVAHVS